MTWQSGHCFAVADGKLADVIEPSRLEEYANVVAAEILEYPPEGPESSDCQLVSIQDMDIFAHETVI